MNQPPAPTVKEVLDAVEQALQRGETRRAAIWLTRVRQSAPLHPRAFHLGGILRHLDNHDDLAIGQLRRSLLLRPTNSAAATQLGVLLNQRSESLASLRIHQQAAAISPDDATVLNNLGNVLAEVNLPERSIAALEKALSVTPSDPTLHANLAIARLKIGAPSAAKWAAKRAILLAPAGQAAYLAVSSASYTVEENDVARRFLDLATTISPLEPGLIANKVQLSLRSGDTASALRDARRGLIGHPNHALLVIRYGAAALESEPRLGKSWRWALAISGMPLARAADFSIRRVRAWKALADPEKRPKHVTFHRLDKSRSGQIPDGSDYVMEVRGAVVTPRSQSILTPDGAVLHEGLSPFTTLLAFGQDAEVFHWNHNGHAILAIPSPDRHLHEAILLGIGGSGNYYHWSIDFLPRLQTLWRHRERLPGLASVPLLISDDCPASILELMRHLGVEEHRLTTVPSDQPIAIDTLYIPSMPAWSISTLGTCLRQRNAMLAPKLKNWIAAGAAHIGSERVYLDRGTAKQRRIANEAEVRQLLREWGFTIVTPDPSNIRQQIASLAKTKIMVSVHGAGLANMSFAPAGCTVIELTYPGLVS